MNAAETAALSRPTEAQLRWAQFRFKRRAASVRQALEVFWQTPLRIEDVDGAMPEDGNTTEESSDAAAPEGRRHSKPRISRGRRALLQVSKRRFLQRRRDIEQHGFKCRAQDMDALSSEDEGEDGLAVIFDEQQVFKRRRRRQRRKGGGADEVDRAKRFDEAFHAVMMNLAATQPQQFELEAPSKIWTRPEGTEGLIGPVNYEGMKVMGHYASTDAAMKRNPVPTGLSPMDRGASWLVHLPKKLKSNASQQLYASATKAPPPDSSDRPVQLGEEEDDDRFSILSDMRSPVPGANSFNDIVDRLQQQLRIGLIDSDDFETPFKKVPVMKLSRYFAPSTKEEEDTAKNSMEPERVQAERSQIELDDAMDADTGSRLKPSREPVPSTRNSDEDEPSQLDSSPSRVPQGLPQSLQHDSSQLKTYAKGYLTISKGAIKFQSPIASLSPLQGDSPVDEPNRRSESIRRYHISEGSDPKRGISLSTHPSPLLRDRPIPDGFVMNLIAKINEAAEKRLLVFADGKLRKPEFAVLIKKYLEEARRTSRNTTGIGLEVALPQAMDTSNAWSESENGKDRDIGGILSANHAEGLIKAMEEAFDKKPFITTSGYVDVPALESVVKGFLCERVSPGERSAASQSQELAAQFYCDKNAGTYTTDAPHRSPFIESFIPLFVESAKAEGFYSGATSIDRQGLLKAVKTCFAYVSDVPLHDKVALVKGVDSDEDSQLMPHSFVSCFSELMSTEAVSRSLFPNRESIDTLRLERISSECAAAALQIILDTDITTSGMPEASNEVRQQTSSESSSKLADDISGRFRGLANILYNENDAPNDHDAIAEFHRRKKAKQDGQHPSSKALPVSVKDAIQRFHASQRQQSPQDKAEKDQATRANDTLSVSDSPDEISTLESQKAESVLSLHRVREITHKVIENSNFLANEGEEGDGSIIDTDGTEVDGASPSGQRFMSNLLLSPTILTKRHQQAIRAIENREWDQVQYLIKANPWLAEMTDFQTGQNLLHKLGMYGSGAALGIVAPDRSSYSAAPQQLNVDLIELFPSAAHKLDFGGNVPLHMAAASANLEMIHLLSIKFPSGASVRNEDGMLPLHLAILAVASIKDSLEPVRIIKEVLQYFPEALAVADNDGNLPIHTAVGCLQADDLGQVVVLLLLDEARKQVQRGLRFSQTQHANQVDESSVPSEISSTLDDIEAEHCTMVLNGRNEMPLITAIRARAGRKIIEALINDPGGSSAVTWQDLEGNNSLHLLVSEEFRDLASVMTVVKVSPEAACARNHDGMLPIEIACINMLPSEVILALVLVDLPFEIHDAHRPTVRKGFGASWNYLTCECDDYFIAVVEEVLLLCSYPQVLSLCFHNEDILSKATPKCRQAMQRALRFLGRFEFIGKGDPASVDEMGSQQFTAIDFGEENERRVLLKIYNNYETFRKETHLLHEAALDLVSVEEILFFEVNRSGAPAHGDLSPQQYCISIELPDLTLAGVLQGMLRNDECQTVFETRRRYAEKVFAVLRIMAKALNHLHLTGIVHGNTCLENCGKFSGTWKLTNMLGCQRVHAAISASRFSHSAPPESVAVSDKGGLIFRDNLMAHPSQDVWGYGKMAYDVLVGKPLIDFQNRPNQDALLALNRWDDNSVSNACQQLARVGVSEEGVNLISHCLAADPDRRPPMDAVLQHPCFRTIRGQQK